MNYGINLGLWNSIFAVPTDVVDKHMKLAGAAQLKVLLYILRHAGEALSLEKLSSAVGQKPADTQDAVEYWINCGIFSANSNSLLLPSDEVSDKGLDAAESVTNNSDNTQSLPNSAPAAEIKNALGEGIKTKAKDKIRYRFDECMKFVAEDSNLKNMLTSVEAVLGKQLNHTDVTCFVTLAKWYGLPYAVIPMLVQYCLAMGKQSINYIESTGIGWAADEIDTLEKAETKIASLMANRKAWNTVRNALEIPERKPTESEAKFCCLWINQQKLDIDLVRLAYDKCIHKQGKISFSYMNGILKNYFENGITDVASALKLDEQYRLKQEAKLASRKSDDTKEKTANGRYATTFDTGDIEAILDAEWMAESVGSDSDYNYDD